MKGGLSIWAETTEIQKPLMYKYCIQMFPYKHMHTQKVHEIHILVAIETSPGIDPLPLSWSEP